MIPRRAAQALLLVWAGAAAAATPLAPRVPALVPAPLPGDLLQATVHRLSNGLTVYLSPNKQEPRVSAWISVRAGSKDDPPDCTGLAHYLEHVLFKGTSKLGTTDWEKERPHMERIVALYERRFASGDPAEREAIYKEIDRENHVAAAYVVPNELGRVYDSLGFNGLNAFTSNEQTVYVCDFPKNRAAVWAVAEAERFAHPVFRLFQTELETVYEEKNRSMDNPGRAVWEAFSLQLFKKHPYGTQTTLGSIEHLKNPSLKRVMEFYRAHYVPNNMAIALAGDFDRASMLGLLEKHFGAWKPAPAPVSGPWELPAPRGEESVSVTFEAEEQVIVGWLGPARASPEADALDVAGMLLNNGRAGIIDLELNQEQKVKWAGGGLYQRNDAGQFTLSASPKQGQTLEEAKALLLSCVEKLKAGAFTADDLAWAVQTWAIGRKRSLEGNGARVSAMTDSFVSREEWAHSAGWLERYAKVTRDDVMRAARAHLGNDRVVAYRRKGKPDLPAITKPGFTEVNIDASRQSAFAKQLHAIPAAPIAPKWLVAGKDYAASDRPFGRLWTAKNPMNDVFTIAIGFVSVGTGTERELGAAFDLLGLSGAGKLPAADFKRKLYALGSDMSYGVDSRWVWIGVSGLEARLEETLRLLIEQCSSPHIASGTLDKYKSVTLGAHQDGKKDPGVQFWALNEYAQRGKDSVVLRGLSDAEVKALSQDRLAALARSVWEFPADVRYVGTRSADEFAALYASVVPAPTRARARSRNIGVIRPAATRVMFTDRDMVQSRVFIYAADGILDPGRQVDYDEYSAYMGGSMSALYFQEVREARALAYSAGGGYEQGHWAGDDNKVTAGMGCQADKTVEGTTLLASLLRNPPVSAERFAAAKKTVIENYRTNPVHFRSIPDTVLSWEEQGVFGGDPRPARFARAQAYTLAELKAFATRFGDAPLTVAILGNKSRVPLDQLKALGPVEEVPLDALFPY